MPKFSIKSKKTFEIVLGLVFFLFCLSIAFYLSTLLVKTDVEVENLSSPEFELYFLSLSKSKLESESQSRSEDFQGIGAGGYVWKNDDYYHVVSSVYANKNDASLVQNSIKLNQNLDSEIFSVKFESITINGTFSSEEGTVLNKALNAIYEYYKKLYDIAISLDTNVYNDISARLAVNNAHNNFTLARDDFQTLFASSKVQEINLISSLLDEGFDQSKLLLSDTRVSANQTYSSHIKYRYTNLLSIYYRFIENIKN